MSQATLVYLYGIVPADAPDAGAELLGLDHAPVRLIRLGRIAALVSDLAADVYGDETLNARLDDLTWVGERGLAHERVLDRYGEDGAIIPSSLFSLHLDDERVRERLRSDEARLAAQIEELRGRREWGVKLWRREAGLAERIGELSPALKALEAEMEKAPEGRRFLLAKKHDALRVEELKRLSGRVVHTVFGALQERAERSVHLPVPPAAPGAEKALVLDAAFLVAIDEYPAFQKRVGEMAGEFQPYGFEFEFTGPWPPYHFAQPDAT